MREIMTALRPLQTELGVARDHLPPAQERDGARRRTTVSARAFDAGLQGHIPLPFRQRFRLVLEEVINPLLVIDVHLGVFAGAVARARTLTAFSAEAT